MARSDELAEYFVASPRRSAELGGRDGVRAAVDAALNQLEVPAELDDEGDWLFQTDVGPFMLAVDGERNGLVLLQTIRVLEEDEDAEAVAGEMQTLLYLNAHSERARFAGLLDRGDRELLGLVARIGLDEVSAAGIEALLLDAMRLSRLLDEAAEQAD